MYGGRLWTSAKWNPAGGRPGGWVSRGFISSYLVLENSLLLFVVLLFFVVHTFRLCTTSMYVRYACCHCECVRSAQCCQSEILQLNTEVKVHKLALTN